MENELTPLQELEQAALAGDREAIISVVSALRRYRELIARWKMSCSSTYYESNASADIEEIEGVSDEDEE